MHIIGTAGHVDHGKSALVQALTGTNPDRWLEEQLRGMTLDLGFAHLLLDDRIEAGIIDVPGHERFLHNMLAGAAGMELLLLVVAANEGAKPQTYEHLAILRYLNVRRTIVVVTKGDLVATDDLPAVLVAIKERLAQTIAADAAVIVVSSVTGEGLDMLRAQIGRELNALQPRDADAPAYLPIDRVFALPGHGTIVTGTLMQGTIAVGDHLMLQPSGNSARIRSLQVFGKSQQRVTAGTRVAANIPSVAVADIARGEVLASAQFEPATTFAVQFVPLEDALPLFRRRTAVKAYIGSAELMGALVFEQVPRDGPTVSAMLHLQRPTIVYPGANFVIRRLSPKTLLGGGTICAATSTAEDRFLDSISADDLRILAVLEAVGLEPIELSKLAAAANLRAELAQESLERLVAQERAVRIPRPQAYVAATRADAFLKDVVARLEAHVRTEPWSMGMTSRALSRMLGVAEPQLLRLLAAFADDGKLAHRAGYYAPLDHVPALTAEQRAFFDRALPVDPKSPSSPASFTDVADQMRAVRIVGLSRAFDTLLLNGALVKVGDDLYRGTQIKQIQRELERLLRERHQITMAEFRDLIGTSRKHAVPLLEWFDVRGITVRSGDYRMLRSRDPAGSPTLSV